MWRSAVQLCTGLRGISSVGLEHLPCTQGVKGSSPLFSTIIHPQERRDARTAVRGLTRPEGLGKETIDMLQKQLDENENTRTPQARACDGKGKESKGGRWIPRLQEAKKDAASCENPW